MHDTVGFTSTSHIENGDSNDSFGSLQMDLSSPTARGGLSLPLPSILSSSGGPAAGAALAPSFLKGVSGASAGGYFLSSGASTSMVNNGGGGAGAGGAGATTAAGGGGREVVPSSSGVSSALSLTTSFSAHRAADGSAPSSPARSVGDDVER